MLAAACALNDTYRNTVESSVDQIFQLAMALTNK